MAEKRMAESNTGSEEPIIAAWLHTPVGNYIRAWEQKHLDALTADIFGFNAVQIGMPQIDALHASRMPYRWLTDNCLPTGAQEERDIPLVVAHDFSALPFATQSLDLVVLPHVLEFSAEPHQVLREVERVLIPEGQSERQIFISCAPTVGETDRLCYAKAREAGNPTSLPLLLHVRKPMPKQ